MDTFEILKTGDDGNALMKHNVETWNIFHSNIYKMFIGTSNKHYRKIFESSIVSN